MRSLTVLGACYIFREIIYRSRQFFKCVTLKPYRKPKRLKGNQWETISEVTTEPWKSKWSSFQIYSLRTMSFRWQIFLFRILYSISCRAPFSVLLGKMEWKNHLITISNIATNCYDFFFPPWSVSNFKAIQMLENSKINSNYRHFYDGPKW